MLTQQISSTISYLFWCSFAETAEATHETENNVNKSSEQKEENTNSKQTAKQKRNKKKTKAPKTKKGFVKKPAKKKLKKSWIQSNTWLHIHSKQATAKSWHSAEWWTYQCSVNTLHTLQIHEWMLIRIGTCWCEQQRTPATKKVYHCVSNWKLCLCWCARSERKFKSAHAQFRICNNGILYGITFTFTNSFNCNINFTNYQVCTKSTNKNLLFVLPPKKVLAFLFASKLQVYLKQFTKEHGQAVRFKTPVESVNQMANLFMNPALKNVTPSTNYAIKINL